LRFLMAFLVDTQELKPTLIEVEVDRSFKPL
jgi:hypothetical protein